MEPRDIKDIPEPVFEKYDIPVVFEGNDGGYGIEWRSFEGGLTSRLNEGIELNEKQYEECVASIEKIKEKYFSQGYMGRDIWGENDNGTYYLKTLMPDSGGGVWMYVFAHEGEPRHLDSRFRRLDLHNVDYTDQVLFFEECLVEYLKYAGINVPGIHSEIVRTIETKREFGDREIIFKENILSYSFELPYLDTSESLIQRGLKNLHNIDGEVQDDKILVNGRVVLEKVQKDNGDLVWLGRDLKDLEVIRLFNTIAECNRIIV